LLVVELLVLPLLLELIELLGSEGGILPHLVHLGLLQRGIAGAERGGISLRLNLDLVRIRLMLILERVKLVVSTRAIRQEGRSEVILLFPRELRLELHLLQLLSLHLLALVEPRLKFGFLDLRLILQAFLDNFLPLVVRGNHGGGSVAMIDDLIGSRSAEARAGRRRSDRARQVRATRSHGHGVTRGLNSRRVRLLTRHILFVASNVDRRFKFAINFVEGLFSGGSSAQQVLDLSGDHDTQVHLVLRDAKLVDELGHK
jgi:hypothetical protein